MNKINLTPDPRILRMLGQIELKGWQCIAEFVDNAIDAMLKERGDAQEVSNRIEVSVPGKRQINKGTPLIVKDNGVGMNEQELENSLRAGYSSQNIENLGLFGMGFNIATARLGDIVEVWTSKEGMGHDIGVKIDLLEMQRSNSFERELLVRAKTFPSSGTSIEVSGFHPRAEKLLNRMQIIRQMNMIYSQSLLDDYGVEIYVNGKPVQPFKMCVWDESRSVTYKGESIPVIYNINHEFGKRSFCQRCLIWLDSRHEELQGDTCCSNCNLKDSVKLKNVTLRGWVGIQRYNHKEDYGFNIIRNGRIIKRFDKSLFTWQDRYERNNGESIFEYPIDTTAQGGRIVGELIADFITPTYTKDNFESTDKLWLDSVEVVRGASPLQPEKAKLLGFRENRSPLAKLFYGYRRSFPPGKRWLIPGTSQGKGMYEAAREWGYKFHDGDPKYQADDIWWEYVVKAEVQEEGGQGDAPDLFMPPDTPNSGKDSGQPGNNEGREDEVSFPGKKVLSFTQKYDLADLLNEKPVSLTVMNYWPESDSLPPIIFDGKSSTSFEVYVNQKHALFVDFADGYEDLIFMELASKFYERASNIEEFSVSRIYYELKRKYASETMLSVEVMVTSAKSLVKDIQAYFCTYKLDHVLSEIPRLSEEEKETLKRSYLQIENKPLNSLEDILQTPAYLKYMDLRHVFGFCNQFPHLLYDGQFFKLPYNEIESKSIRESQLGQYQGFMNDLSWIVYELSEFADELIRKQKGLIIRNKFSLDFLNGKRS